ncbi:MAG: fumarylacetoacetase, partial [Actinomycetota bacterium]|nr:fumarylacetoacetase [Actinomycetota bacterium]
MTSWLPPADGFGIDHLPYGAAQAGDGGRIAVVRIGSSALDLTAATAQLAAEHAPLFADGTLDGLLAAGRARWAQVRSLIVRWLSDEAYRPALEPLLMPIDGLALRMPFAVADYVDFYASQAHATNVGRLFRPDGEPLTPNWKHLPIGYHGRAGTVVVSGTEVSRPAGQRRG